MSPNRKRDRAKKHCPHFPSPHRRLPHHLHPSHIVFILPSSPPSFLLHQSHSIITLLSPVLIIFSFLYQSPFFIFNLHLPVSSFSFLHHQSPFILSFPSLHLSESGSPVIIPGIFCSPCISISLPTLFCGAHTRR
jgi:hypothetical protein